MFFGPAPRPWIMITAARASPSGAPPGGDGLAGVRREWPAQEWVTFGRPASMAARCGSSHGGSLREVPSSAERLVEGEAGRNRGHLEQDAAGLAEVDRSEILPVHHLGYRYAPPDQLVAQLELLLRIVDGERDVVHGAQSVDGGGRVPGAHDLEQPPRRIVVHRKAGRTDPLAHHGAFH